VLKVVLAALALNDFIVHTALAFFVPPTLWGFITSHRSSPLCFVVFGFFFFLLLFPPVVSGSSTVLFCSECTRIHSLLCPL